ncbi:ABC transporter ATP-binding protein [Mycoplasmopsis alligatoris]|uniref:ABC transporter, ATP-binding protein n=1 Tax=Mycoplasmopsis alligatoris A21JP2 TaxID=747682 RepID=D4XWI1_9BACT|nr:ABC transporter ATP-binding protein [Mycoplasmopsis alligatoris]EFF41161.1 ABC transporter, ATP-binding protein [Mycoplasmopsis alligatoris A21JP2]
MPKKEQEQLKEMTQIIDLKSTTDTKITKHNVFEVLDQDGGVKQSKVARNLTRILKRSSNIKRKKDENKGLVNSENAIIEVKNVSKYYLSGDVVTRVLKNINLTINRGEIVVIVGTSGGGKSTLLNLISGLDRPSKGDVIVNNVNLPYLSDSQLTHFRRKNVCFIFQNYNLLQNLSGYDNVETGSYLQKDPNKKFNITELFEQFDLVDVMDKYPSQMSGGQQQRISVLRALAKNSDIVFADEPTGALDNKTTEVVLTALYDMNKKYGSTIIIVTHNPDIEKIATTVVRINNGRIQSLKKNKKPLHPSKIEIKEQ